MVKFNLTDVVKNDGDQFLKRRYVSSKNDTTSLLLVMWFLLIKNMQ